MEKENIDPAMGSQGETPTRDEGTGNEQQKAIVENAEPGLEKQITGEGSARAWPPQPTLLTLQDLLDLPRQIIPEETYIHLRNACREALLAVVSLVSGFNN